MYFRVETATKATSKCAIHSKGGSLILQSRCWNLKALFLIVPSLLLNHIRSEGCFVYVDYWVVIGDVLSQVLSKFHSSELELV